MQVKMLEFVQGRDVRGMLPDGTVTLVLEPEKVYDVDESLAVWLLQNRKAEKVEVEEVKVKEVEANPEPPIDTQTVRWSLPSRRRNKKIEN